MFIIRRIKKVYIKLWYLSKGNHLIEEKQNELARIIEHQKQEIKRLREAIEDLERRGTSRPTSTSQLPPLPMPVNWRIFYKFWGLQI